MKIGGNVAENHSKGIRRNSSLKVNVIYRIAKL